MCVSMQFVNIFSHSLPVSLVHPPTPTSAMASPSPAAPATPAAPTHGPEANWLLAVVCDDRESTPLSESAIRTKHLATLQRVLKGMEEKGTWKDYLLTEPPTRRPAAWRQEHSTLASKLFPDGVHAAIVPFASVAWLWPLLAQRGVGGGSAAAAVATAATATATEGLIPTMRIRVPHPDGAFAGAPRTVYVRLMVLLRADLMLCWDALAALAPKDASPRIVARIKKGVWAWLNHYCSAPGDLAKLFAWAIAFLPSKAQHSVRLAPMWNNKAAPTGVLLATAALCAFGCPDFTWPALLGREAWLAALLCAPARKDCSTNGGLVDFALAEAPCEDGDEDDGDGEVKYGFKEEESGTKKEEEEEESDTKEVEEEGGSTSNDAGTESETVPLPHARGAALAVLAEFVRRLLASCIPRMSDTSRDDKYRLRASRIVYSRVMAHVLLQPGSDGAGWLLSVASLLDPASSFECDNTPFVLLPLKPTRGDHAIVIPPGDITRLCASAPTLAMVQAVWSVATACGATTTVVDAASEPHDYSTCVAGGVLTATMDRLYDTQRFAVAMAEVESFLPSHFTQPVAAHMLPHLTHSEQFLHGMTSDVDQWWIRLNEPPPSAASLAAKKVTLQTWQASMWLSKDKWYEACVDDMDPIYMQKEQQRRGESTAVLSIEDVTTFHAASCLSLQQIEVGVERLEGCTTKEKAVVHRFDQSMVRMYMHPKEGLCVFTEAALSVFLRMCSSRYVGSMKGDTNMRLQVTRRAESLRRKGYRLWLDCQNGDTCGLPMQVLSPELRQAVRDRSPQALPVLATLAVCRRRGACDLPRRRKQPFSTHPDVLHKLFNEVTFQQQGDIQELFRRGVQYDADGVHALRKLATLLPTSMSCTAFACLAFTPRSNQEARRLSCIHLVRQRISESCLPDDGCDSDTSSDSSDSSDYSDSE